jgi:hypothetical protein
MSLTKISLGGNNDVIYKLFPPRESLVSDIPAQDGNIDKLFLRCTVLVGNQKLSPASTPFPVDMEAEITNCSSPPTTTFLYLWKRAAKSLKKSQDFKERHISSICSIPELCRFLKLSRIIFLSCFL